MSVTPSNSSSSSPVTTFCSSECTPLLFTTNPGLEDVVIDEFRQRSTGAGLTVLNTTVEPFDRAGYALVESAGPRAKALAVAQQMRSAHHLLELHYAFPLSEMDPLDTLYDVVEALDLSAMENAESFRVTTVRSGDHDFTSVDVQRVAGAALEAHYGTAVDLENYAVEVRVDVHDAQCLVSVQHTRTALSQRHTRVYEPHAALKPNVAFAMLQLAQLDAPPDALLDPFCGSGTILLEAAACWPDARIVGGDWDEEAVAGARRNAKAEGLAERISLRRADARQMADEFADVHVPLIVTNPPFGVRLGRRMSFFPFYRRVLGQAAEVLVPGGRLVVLVDKPVAFNRALQQAGPYDVRHVRVIELGGLYPRLFVLERQ